MKQRKLAPLIALSMSLQMILAPVAHAQMTGADIFGGVLGTVATIHAQVSAQNLPPPPHLANDMAKFQIQKSPMPDKYFKGAELSKIPGLGQYLLQNNINPNELSCVTLPTNLHKAENEVCRVGLTLDKGNPAMQMQEALAYMVEYKTIESQYHNFQTVSNVGKERFGVGCMTNAMQILNGFFKNRTDELTALLAKVEKIQSEFKRASEADLKRIEETTALLNGGQGELGAKVQTNNPGILDFGKKFSSPECKSMFSKTEMDKLGAGGLNAISQQLEEITNTKVGSAQLSGANYSQASADVERDVEILAEKVRKQMELNFDSISESPKGYADVAKDMSNISSANGLNGALGDMDIFQNAQSNLRDAQTKMQSTLADVSSELGNAGGNALSQVRNINSGSFESEVKTVERNINNQCFRSNANIDNMMSTMYDPTSSKFANKNAANFAPELRAALENPQTTLDEKLAELRKLEAENGSRHFLDIKANYSFNELDKSGNVVKKIVKAGNKTPSAFFADIITNCKTQFKTNKLNDKLTGAAAVQKLRQLHQDYKNLAKTHAAEVKADIKARLLQCKSSATGSATPVKTCTTNSFDTSKPGFCAKTASTCASNMQKCNAEAEQLVTKVKADQTALVKNYRALVEKNKNDIVKLFDDTLSRYAFDSKLLRAQFGVGFEIPSGIQREIPAGQGNIDLLAQATSGSPDGALLLEDPAKFTEMFKNNIQLLKNEVTIQQEKILGGDVESPSGILAKHVADTKANYAKVESEAKAFHDRCQAQHDGAIKELDAQNKANQTAQAQKQTELGEKSQEFCRRYGLAQQNPGPACDGGVQELTSAVAQLPGGRDAGYEFERVCAGQSEGSGGNSIQAASKYCLRNEKPATQIARQKISNEIKVAQSGVVDANSDKDKASLTKANEALAAAKLKLEDFDKKNPAISPECGQLMNCLRDESSVVTGTTVTKLECNEDLQVTLAELVVEASGGNLKADPQLQPAFCVGGFNGTGPKNVFETFNESLQKGFNAGAVQN